MLPFSLATISIPIIFFLAPLSRPSSGWLFKLATKPEGAVMNQPQVAIDFKNARLIARCACQQWRLDVPFSANDTVTKLLEKIDAAYSEHLKTCDLPAAEQT